MNVVGGADLPGGGSGAAGDNGFADRLALKRALGGGEADRPVRNPERADADVAKFLLRRVKAHRGRRQGKIAAPAGEFPETVTALPRPRRKTNLGDDLV